MVNTRKKTYTSVAKLDRTPRKTLFDEAAELGVSFGSNGEFDDTSVLTGEGQLKTGKAPPVDQNALRAENPPGLRTSELDTARVLGLGGLRMEQLVEDKPVSHVNEMKAEGLSRSSPWGSSSCSPSDKSRGSPQIGTECKAVGFVIPRKTVKPAEKSSIRLAVDSKFFPTWFDLSLEDDQLGPIPKDWECYNDKLDESSSSEDDEIQKAITRSLDIYQPENRSVSSMAVIVEVKTNEP